jgi:hypothetical protein
MLGVPALAGTPNAVAISATGTPSGSGLNKTITVNATVTYTTGTATPPWAQLDSVATVELKWTTKNAMGTVIQNGTLILDPSVVPNLGKLEYHGATGSGKKHKKTASFSVSVGASSFPGASSVKIALKVNISATWTRTSGNPSSDVKTASWKSAIH